MWVLLGFLSNAPLPHPMGASEATVQQERLEHLPQEACGPCLIISFSICSIPFMLHKQQVWICSLHLEVSPEVIH